MFSTFERCHPSDETEANKKILTKHLRALKEVYIVFQTVNVSTFERVRNTFVANNVSGLMTCEQEQLIDIS
jgi:hypothetical protein